MKTLEVRRHSLTKKGSAREAGSLLSADGVAQARRLGEQLPPAGYVVTGPDRRHVETAIAMGYAVDEMVNWPSGYVNGVVDHHDQWRWEAPYEQYAHLLETSAALREVAEAHLGHWLRAVDQVSEGETALVVSSGGSIEPVLVAAHPGWRPHRLGLGLAPPGRRIFVLRRTPLRRRHDLPLARSDGVPR